MPEESIPAEYPAKYITIQVANNGYVISTERGCYVATSKGEVLEFVDLLLVEP